MNDGGISDNHKFIKTYTKSLSRAFSGTLTAAYKALGPSGYDSWRVENIIENPGRYKYVLLVDEVRAQSESLVYDRNLNGNLSFKVLDQAGGEIQVEVPENVTAKCSGANAVCYINAEVIVPYTTREGNTGFRTALSSEFDRARLPAAFRAL